MDCLNNETKQSLRLAAAGALLHNLGKISAKFLDKQINSGSPDYLYQHIVGLIFPYAHCFRSSSSSSPLDDLRNRFSATKLEDSRILDCKTVDSLQHALRFPSPLDDRPFYVVGDLIEYLGQGSKESLLYRSIGGRFGIEHIFPNGSRLTHLMNRAHRGASGGEKQNITATKQPNANNLYLSTPFGYEKPAPGMSQIDNLRQQAERIIQQYLYRPDAPFSLAEFTKKIMPVLNQTIADTRRPLNDVTVGNIGHTGMAFLLTQAVGWILTNRSIDHHELSQVGAHNTLLWRIYSVQTDTLRYIREAPSLADLRVRQRELRGAFQEIHRNLEDTLLAVEIYGDEQTHIFIVPDLGDEEHDAYKKLGNITEQTHCNGLQFAPLLSAPVTNHPEDQNGNYIGDEIRRFLQISPSYKWNPETIADFWAGEPTERCVSCNVRPQGYGAEQVDAYKHNPDYYRRKAQERHLCCICMDKRRGVSEEWAKESLSTTIWVNEISDQNRRLALILGKFEIEVFVRALFYDSGSHNGTSNFSFARLHRIWETTRKFWQEVAPTDENISLADSLIGEKVGTRRERLEIKGDLQPCKDGDSLGAYHAYKLVLDGGIRLAVVWDPENERFITADNLHYLEGKNQLGQPLKNVLRKGNVFQVLEPIGYGASDKVWGTITLSEDAGKIENSTYTPLIPILAEPRTFMALVPADKAVDVVQAIRTKYEREMGKVRNRLPLHLGVVFADAHTPLRAILDAGRRMLKQKTIGKVGKWEVEDVTKQSGALPGKAANLAQGTRQFDKWYAVKLKHEDTGRTLTWYVPAVMGDGSTEDNWYPYVFWEQDKDGNTDPGSATIQRKRYYQAPNPFKLDAHGKPQLGWLVHAGELEPGDKVYFTPATLDFQWLDSSASRFEIAYDGENGQRKGNFSRRPYLLDELDTLEHIWNTLSEHLTTSQIHALVSLIESRREDWEVSPHDDTFRVFCRNALANAKWQARPWEREGKAREDWLEEWVNYAALGWLTDAVEIWMKIMKEKPVADKTQGGNA